MKQLLYRVILHNNEHSTVNDNYLYTSRPFHFPNRFQVNAEMHLLNNGMFYHYKRPLTTWSLRNPPKHFTRIPTCLIFSGSPSCHAQCGPPQGQEVRLQQLLGSSLSPIPMSSSAPLLISGEQRLPDTEGRNFPIFIPSILPFHN